MLLSVPNLSIGSGRGRIDQLEAAFGSTATLLDSHSDGTHGRTVILSMGRIWLSTNSTTSVSGFTMVGSDGP